MVKPTFEFNAAANYAIDEWNRREHAPRPILVGGNTLANLQAARNGILIPLAGTDGILLRPSTVRGLVNLINLGATPARLTEVLTNTIFASARHIAAATSGNVILTRERAEQLANALLANLRTATP